MDNRIFICVLSNRLIEQLIEVNLQLNGGLREHSTLSTSSSVVIDGKTYEGKFEMREVS